MTSVRMFVRAHATRSLWPMTTPGMPENENPATSNGQLVVTVVQCSPTWYQMPGSDVAR